jgi:hypothetical protein
MGFIFRTVFWLSVAMIIVPPQARLGGGEGDVDLRDIDLGYELHTAAYAAWGLVADAASACDANPELCKSATKLWDTTVKTAAGLGGELTEHWKDAEEKSGKLAENAEKTPKKIQARVE